MGFLQGTREESLPALGSGYQVLRELGSGGEGKVYLVRHLATDQLRAAKQLLSPAGRDRLHELHMMKRLRHPSLPLVFDVLEVEGSIFLILEYIRGERISELAVSGMGEEQMGSVFLQLTEVLGYLHSREPPILHLDIKPANLLLRKDGVLVLIDFGAAVRLGKEGIARTERCYGTPGFAAPEQYQRHARVDVRTDVYGIGAVMRFCLFGGDMAGKERSQTGGRGLRGWRRDAAAVASRCLAEVPANRYPDCQSLLQALLRAERRRHLTRKGLQIGGTSLLLLLLLVFSANALLAEYAVGQQARAEDSGKLLQEADSLGFSGACACYEQAVRREPGDSAVFLHFMGRVMRDGYFSLEEEEELRKLLFTVYPGQEGTAEELLAQEGEGYGELAYRIGLCYWYYYEGTGGKTAAARWFGKAADTLEGEGKPEWGTSAQIHARIAGYYERLGQEGTDQQEEYWRFWCDMGELWEEPGFQEEPGSIRRQLAEEMLACMLLRAGELRQRGESEEALLERLEALKAFAGTADCPEEDQAALLAQCESAGAAIQRAFKEMPERP